MSNLKDVTFIIPTRNNNALLHKCLESVRENYPDNKIIIAADDCTPITKAYIDSIKKKYSFDYFTESERTGIVNTVDKLVSMVETPIVFYIHDDMIVGKDCVENLLKHLKVKRTITATRIEPPLHPPEKCKLIQHFGIEAEEFKKTEFDSFVEQAKQVYKDQFTKGIFAPFMFYKDDWLGHDKLFSPQSHEDSDLFYRMVIAGKELIQSRDAFVYHFTSRGSRFKEGVGKDSSEWQYSNTKNLLNFIRKWGTRPLYDDNKHPVIIKKIPISGVVLIKNEGPLVYNFLANVEPYFDELIFLNDMSTDNTKEEINRYIKDTLLRGPTNFDKSKITIIDRPLKGDFGGQTNYGIEIAKNDWVMKLDVDEQVPYTVLDNLGRMIMECQNRGAKVVAFPRINVIDGRVINDLPVSDWYTNKGPLLSGQQISIRNPDIQFRLFRKDVRLINKVHEIPECVVKDKDSFIVSPFDPLYHNKSSDRQKRQNAFYDDILKEQRKNMNKIIYDSVIFTTEGITKHAREEVLQWAEKGYKIQLLDFYRENPYVEHSKEMTGFYNPINIDGDDYFVICNQPPERWAKTIFLKNFYGYLAFEGELPDEWVQIMNHPNVKGIMTPSNYCKEKFLKSGVKTPVYVVPHGVDPKIWKPKKIKKFDKITYLVAGTLHNNRKGIDVVIKAFEKTFSGNDNVQLVLKLNKIYNKEQNVQREIAKLLKNPDSVNISVITQDLTEEEMVELYNKSHFLVNAHRSEGFGIHILQAMACGIPVIVTGKSGNMDFCSADNSLLIDTDGPERWSPLKYPYTNAKWFEPSQKHLEQLLIKGYEDYEQLSKLAIENSETIRKEWTWKSVVDKMEQIIKGT